VTISNGRLTERAEFRVSPQVMRTLARGADAPSDEQVCQVIAQQVRRDMWEKIKERAAAPTRLLWNRPPKLGTLVRPVGPPSCRPLCPEFSSSSTL
jgi:hypothetical protein